MSVEGIRALGLGFYSFRGLGFWGSGFAGRRKDFCIHSRAPMSSKQVLRRMVGYSSLWGYIGATLGYIGVLLGSTGATVSVSEAGPQVCLSYGGAFCSQNQQQN